MESHQQQLPLIDISPLMSPAENQEDADFRMSVAQQIDLACRQYGFFRICGHGVPKELQSRLDTLSREFFNLPREQKESISMIKGGSAWRGWFPVGDELTSGKPDQKEGIYFGQELPDDHSRVLAKEPLHGKNLFPEHPADLGKTVLEWQHQMSLIGKALLTGIALGLGIGEDWFDKNICKNPTELFRIFHYPPSVIKEGEHPGWGVGEHTDYGLVTILAQDDCGGLEVKLPGDHWIKVPPESGVFIVNIGDMLDKLTEGRYLSTPHRVLNASGRQRLSFPFFVDPSWDAEVTPPPLEKCAPPLVHRPVRWDAQNVHAWTGQYGNYLVGKVSKVFPKLFAELKQ